MSETTYKICPSCNTHAAINHAFCKSCGHQFSTQPESLPIPEPEPPYRQHQPVKPGKAKKPWAHPVVLIVLLFMLSNSIRVYFRGLQETKQQEAAYRQMAAAAGVIIQGEQATEAPSDVAEEDTGISAFSASDTYEINPDAAPITEQAEGLPARITSDVSAKMTSEEQVSRCQRVAEILRSAVKNQDWSTVQDLYSAPDGIDGARSFVVTCKEDQEYLRDSEIEASQIEIRSSGSDHVSFTYTHSGNWVMEITVDVNSAKIVDVIAHDI